MESKLQFISFGSERIPLDKIKEYYIANGTETSEEREQRKKNSSGNGTAFGMFKGSMAATPIAVPLMTIANPALGVGALAVGAVAGAVKGNKKNEKKFEENPKNATLDHSVLVIKLYKGFPKMYHADSCGFDIYEKRRELDTLFHVR